MTVKELIEDLEKMPPDATPSVECEPTGDGSLNHSVYADGNLAASWDLEDE